MSPTLDQSDDRDLHLDEVLAAYLEAVDAGWAPPRDDVLARYPHFRAELEAFCAAQDEVHTRAKPFRSEKPARSNGRSPHADVTAGATETAATLADDLPRSFGDYELLEEIARGGMGVVYRARQKGLNRPVALKMILAGKLASPADVQRFRNEAEATALMDHPGIVPIYEVGQHGAQHYFSMKLIEGGSLAERGVRRQGAGVAKEEMRWAAALVAKVARAVHYAHQRGILHRDLKPANILLDEHGQPLVTDFGLAKRVEGDAGLTQSGAILGTPNYMAPEQALGRAAGLTTAADLHSLGAILYEWLTGRPPFEAGNPLDTLLKLREEKPVPPRGLNPRVDADLETICLKCLEKEPQRRYVSAAALADDLERWLAGGVIQARRAGVWLRVLKWVRRRPALAVLAALAVLSLLLGVGYAGMLLQLRETVAEKQSAEQAREDAMRENRRAESALNANRIMRAHFEWLDNDVLRAERILDECPSQARSWEWRYVKRLCHADLFTFHGHAQPVLGVAFNPDGTCLASAGLDRTVKVWDAATGREQLTFVGHTASVFSVAFSPDGSRVASAGDDRTVKVWDTGTGRECFTVKGHTDTVHQVTFSSDGKWLASAGYDGTARLWHAASGQEGLILRGHRAGVSGVAFSPDGKRLASSSHDQTVKVWDTATGREELTLRGHTSAVYAVAFGPDGKRLASASHDQTVRVWDATTGQAGPVFRGHTCLVVSVAFSSDGTRLASCSGGFGFPGELMLWDAATGQEDRTLRGHTRNVHCVAFSPDGKRLASAAYDHTVKVWDTVHEPEALTLRGHTRGVHGVAFSPDGGRVASAAKDRLVKIWDVARGSELLTLSGHTDEVHSVAFSPDGRWLASGGRDRVVRLWDTATGRPERVLAGHNHAIHGLAFSPDGRRLASASWDQTAKVWDTTTGEAVLTLAGHMGEVYGVAFSPDGRRLATGSKDQTVRLWDSATGAVVFTLTGHTAEVYGVAFSPDGERLASASRDGTVKLWEAATGQQQLTFKWHSNWAVGIAFDPSGKRLASASHDRTVKVWDAVMGQEYLSLKGHSAAVYGVAFSPEGNRLASASADGTVRIWDATPLDARRADLTPP